MPSVDVPVFQQPKGSVLCGPTCARMIMAFHGVDMSLKKIAAEMPMIKTGVDAGGLGRFFLSHGFKVKLNFWLMGMEPRWFGVQDPDELRVILGRKINDPLRRYWDWYRTRLRKYVDAGGDLILRPVMASDLDRELRSGHPAILSINDRLMDQVGRANRGHYVVINHVSDRDTQASRPMVGFADPGDGREHTMYLEDMMFYTHIWFGSAIFIRPD